MSGVNRLVLADTKGTHVPTNEEIREEGIENMGSAEERKENK